MVMTVDNAKNIDINLPTTVVHAQLYFYFFDVNRPYHRNKMQLFPVALNGNMGYFVNLYVNFNEFVKDIVP